MEKEIFKIKKRRNERKREKESKNGMRLNVMLKLTFQRCHFEKKCGKWVNRQNTTIALIFIDNADDY